MSFKLLLSVTIAVLFFNAVESQGFLPPTFGTPASRANVVSDNCLKCLCNAATGCSPRACVGGLCGQYGISRLYWEDAGRAVVFGDQPDAPTAFENCANDPTCAATTVRNYMAKWPLDRNKDGVVNCDDFAIIHHHGGPGSFNQVSSPLSFSVRQCLNTACLRNQCRCWLNLYCQ